jgi:hypothetical protein
MRTSLARFSWIVALAAVAWVFATAVAVVAQDDVAPASDVDREADAAEGEAQADVDREADSTQQSIAPESDESAGPRGLVRLAKDYDIWIDPMRKIVVVDGEICLTKGYLELFACPKGTKTHEAIVAVNSKAKFVHAALLAVGAKAGKPATWDPEYAPASGDEVEVLVLWRDADGKNQKVRAQDWIRNAKTGKALEIPWVFGGSGFWTDENTGERYYQADGGDLICVSNFPTAMLDLPVESSQANADLAFEAFTERIPPKGTKVRLVLVPKIAKPDKSGDDSEMEK